MFEDLIKTNNEEIKIIISRKIINELYALHGEVGILRVQLAQLANC